MDLEAFGGESLVMTTDDGRRTDVAARATLSTYRDKGVGRPPTAGIAYEFMHDIGQTSASLMRCWIRGIRCDSWRTISLPQAHRGIPYAVPTFPALRLPLCTRVERGEPP
nr:hypothetical protein CFP56_01053 [Quercus suber]